jgi:hypothetical protein
MVRESREDEGWVLCLYIQVYKDGVALYVGMVRESREHEGWVLCLYAYKEVIEKHFIHCIMSKCLSTHQKHMHMSLIKELDEGAHVYIYICRERGASLKTFMLISVAAWMRPGCRLHTYTHIYTCTLSWCTVYSQPSSVQSMFCYNRVYKPSRTHP